MAYYDSGRAKISPEKQIEFWSFKSYPLQIANYLSGSPKQADGFLQNLNFIRFARHILTKTVLSPLPSPVQAEEKDSLPCANKDKTCPLVRKSHREPSPCAIRQNPYPAVYCNPPLNLHKRASRKADL